ncbi:MAG: hypothetical protein O3B01_24895 [Planctomycetota bacterium]|nr:hypothetical protein [Planctomycetota bacterium]MDA1141815.1 hypothetical protein [Planctomycetota bacterium]
MSSTPRQWIENSRSKLAAGEFVETDLNHLEALLDGCTQKILYLYSKSTSMRSAIGGWALYDPTRPHEPELPSQDPPYSSVIAAVADGWRIVQFPRPELHRFSDMDNEYLAYEFILERLD